MAGQSCSPCGQEAGKEQGKSWGPTIPVISRTDGSASFVPCYSHLFRSATRFTLWLSFFHVIDSLLQLHLHFVILSLNVCLINLCFIKVFLSLQINLENFILPDFSRE